MLNLGIIGCGYWGPNLIRNFDSLQDCAVKKVCDCNSSRLSHIKSIYPQVEIHSDFNDLLEDQDIDAVAIATPVRFHFDMAKKSLLSGKHTFIEKPMAASVQECVELIELSEEKKLTLMVGHTFIFSPAVRKIKDIVKSGDIGVIQYIRSQRLNLGLFQKDINVAWDLSPHDISIILYIMKEFPTSVNCQGKAHYHKEIEDVTIMTLNFSNGGFATIQSSWLDPTKIREMTFVGSKRMLVYNDIEPIEKIKIYDKRVETPPHYDTFAEFHYSYHHGDMYSPYLNQFEPLRLECQNFIDSIRTGEKPETGAREGIQVVQILEAASQSLKLDGAKVHIPKSQYW